VTPPGSTRLGTAGPASITHTARGPCSGGILTPSASGGDRPMHRSRAAAIVSLLWPVCCWRPPTLFASGRHQRERCRPSISTTFAAFPSTMIQYPPHSPPILNLLGADKSPIPAGQVCRELLALEGEHDGVRLPLAAKSLPRSIFPMLASPLSHDAATGDAQDVEHQLRRAHLLSNIRPIRDNLDARSSR